MWTIDTIYFLDPGLRDKMPVRWEISMFPPVENVLNEAFQRPSPKATESHVVLLGHFEMRTREILIFGRRLWKQSKLMGSDEYLDGFNLEFIVFEVIGGHVSKVYSLKQRNGIPFSASPASQCSVSLNHLVKPASAKLIPKSITKRSELQWPICCGKPMILIGVIDLSEKNEVLKKHFTYDSTLLLFVYPYNDRIEYSIVTVDVVEQTIEEHYKLEDESHPPPDNM